MSKTIFILGAGASRDLEFKFTTIDAYSSEATTSHCQGEGPLSLGFFYDTNLLINKINRNISIPVSLFIPQRLQEYVCEYYQNKTRHPVTFEKILNDKATSQKVSIEDLCIDIENKENSFEKEDKITHDEAKIFGIKMDLDSYYHTSISIICNFCFSIYHAKLAQYLSDCGGNVISFNWDILLDEAMYHTKDWDYSTGYDIDFKKLIYKDGDTPYFKTNGTSANLILKPHGSINWYKNNEKEEYSLFYPLSRNMRGGSPTTYLRKTECDNNSNYYSSAALPPGKHRDAFPNLWVKIKETMEEANSVVVIGFHFKETDDHFFKKISQYKFKKDIKIQLVDPRAKELVPRYKEIFDTNNVEILFANFKEYCEYIMKDNFVENR